MSSGDALVEKRELLDAVWPGVAVEEGVLSRNIFALRQALGRSADGGQYIATIPKRGYRFAGGVRAVPEDAEIDPAERTPPTVAKSGWAPRHRVLIPSAGMAVLVVVTALIANRWPSPWPNDFSRPTFRRLAVAQEVVWGVIAVEFQIIHRDTITVSRLAWLSAGSLQSSAYYSRHPRSRSSAASSH